MEKNQKFDARALIQPKSREDMASIFSEILSELANLHRHLDAVAADCQKELQTA